jgi:hypothetical protein
VDNNAALQFTVCTLGGAIVREERGRLDKNRDHQFRKLLERRMDKAVNEELQNLYEIVLVSVLSPIAQGQQLGVESQAKAQAPRDMNHQGPQAAVNTVNVQDTRTVPGARVLHIKRI